MADIIDERNLENDEALSGKYSVIEDVSFVVIARNEEYAVDKCLSALVNMPLANCEILAVDSDSSDRTLDIMKKYANESELVSVFQCSGNVNASIGRNVGLDRASKKYICFCDGDTEWNAEFLREAISIMSVGDADAVTGVLQERIYSPDHEQVVGERTRRQFRCTNAIWYCGGNVIVSNAIARVAGRFDERMVVNEDKDYSLRVSRHGRVVGIPCVMGIHHTLGYSIQVLREFASKGLLRYHGVVLRRNLDRPRVMATLLLENRGFVAGYVFYALCLAAFAMGVKHSSWLPYAAVAPLVFLLVDVTWTVLRGKNLLKQFLSHYCYPLWIAVGFLLGAGSRPAATKVQRIC